MGSRASSSLFTQGEADPVSRTVRRSISVNQRAASINTPRTFRAVTTPQFLDNLSILKGAHQFALGVNMRFYQHNDQRGQPGGINVTPTHLLPGATRSPRLSARARHQRDRLTALLGTINDLLESRRVCRRRSSAISMRRFLPFQRTARFAFDVGHTAQAIQLLRAGRMEAAPEPDDQLRRAIGIQPAAQKRRRFTFCRRNRSSVRQVLSTVVTARAVTFIKADRWYEVK